jgi:hypothetical protein
MNQEEEQVDLLLIEAEGINFTVAAQGTTAVVLGSFDVDTTAAIAAKLLEQDTEDGAQKFGIKKVIFPGNIPDGNPVAEET